MQHYARSWAFLKTTLELEGECKLTYIGSTSISKSIMYIFFLLGTSSFWHSIYFIQISTFKLYWPMATPSDSYKDVKKCSSI